MQLQRSRADYGDARNAGQQEHAAGGKVHRGSGQAPAHQSLGAQSSHSEARLGEALRDLNDLQAGMLAASPPRFGGGQHSRAPDLDAASEAWASASGCVAAAPAVRGAAAPALVSTGAPPGCFSAHVAGAGQDWGFPAAASFDAGAWYHHHHAAQPMQPCPMQQLGDYRDPVALLWGAWGPSQQPPLQPPQLPQPCQPPQPQQPQPQQQRLPISQRQRQPSHFQAPQLMSTPAPRAPALVGPPMPRPQRPPRNGPGQPWPGATSSPPEAASAAGASELRRSPGASSSGGGADTRLPKRTRQRQRRKRTRGGDQDTASGAHAGASPQQQRQKDRCPAGKKCSEDDDNATVSTASPPHSHSTAASPLDQGAEETLTCRICFEAKGPDFSTELLSPCQCRGSQKYVHRECHRRWQACVQSMRGRGAALRCDVCRARLPLALNLMVVPAVESRRIVCTLGLSPRGTTSLTMA